MGIGPFSSESSATDNRVGADNQSQAVGSGAKVANPGSILVSDKSSFTLNDARGGILLRDKSNLRIGGSIERSTITGDVYFSDPATTQGYNAAVQQLANQNAALLEVVAAGGPAPGVPENPSGITTTEGDDDPAVEDPAGPSLWSRILEALGIDAPLNTTEDQRRALKRTLVLAALVAALLLRWLFRKK